jgi:hypothetical protein
MHMFADTFHEKLVDAMNEASRRRAHPDGKGFVTRVERSPYGGYRVRSLPAEFYVDQLADGPAVLPIRLLRRWADLIP